MHALNENMHAARRCDGCETMQTVKKYRFTNSPTQTRDSRVHVLVFSVGILVRVPVLMCCTPAVNNKRHASVCGTRLSVAWRWPARSKKGKTPSALAFHEPLVDSLYMVELKLDVN